MFLERVLNIIGYLLMESQQRVQMVFCQSSQAVPEISKKFSCIINAELCSLKSGGEEVQERLFNHTFHFLYMSYTV